MFISNNADDAFTSKYLASQIEEALDQLGYILDSMVGAIMPFMKLNPPRGFLLCDGTEYNIADYQDLANSFEDNLGASNFFGGDGVTTFAVPNLQGEFLRGTGVNAHTGDGDGANIGVHQNNGLPNIKSWFEGICNGIGGAMRKDNYGASIGGGGSGMVAGEIRFKASRSSSIYGASSYVIPPNTSVLWCIKY